MIHVLVDESLINLLNVQVSRAPGIHTCSCSAWPTPPERCRPRERCARSPASHSTPGQREGPPRRFAAALPREAWQEPKRSS